MQIDGLSAALGGIQSAVNRSSEAAQEIATANVRGEGTQKLVEPLVELQVAELEVKANAKAVESELKTLGSIIDIKA